MRIFFAVHGFPPRANAGTETYARELARALQRAGDEIFVLARESDPSRRELSIRRELRGGLQIAWLNNGFRKCRSLQDVYRNGAIRKIAARLLDEFRPDVAHIHHLSGLSTELVTELDERGIPSLLTLNDFWLICQRGQLLDLDLRRCPGPSPAGCARCLSSSIEAARERMADVRALFDRVTTILCPSRTVREQFVSFGVDERRLVLQEQGIDLAPFAVRPPRLPGPMRVTFVGTLMVSKAPHLLLEAAAGLPPGAVSLTLAGAFAPYHGDSSYRGVLDSALAKVEARLVGELGRGEVSHLLLQSDVLVAPSIWLENSPFVVKEAFAAGVPVVASDLGGLRELVRHEVNGLLFAAGDARALESALSRLLVEPGLVNRLRIGIQPVRSIVEDAAETRHRYREAVAQSSRAPSQPSADGMSPP